MVENNPKKQKRLRYAAIILAVVFLFSVFLVFINIWERSNGDYSLESEIDNAEFIEYNGKKYIPNDDIESFLVLGLDKFSDNTSDESYNNNQQSDFLMLFVFDNSLKEYSAFHINRDTMTEVNRLGLAGEKIDSEVMQIALAHTYGNGREVSCRNVTDALSKMLYGVEIKNFVSVTMDSVPIYNDLLGGVEVTVLDDLTSVDSSLVKGENVVLRGELALKYVRTRYGLEDSTNATRMERQKQYLEALRQKTVSRMASDQKFAANAVLKMSDYMVSNRTITQLQDLLNKFSEYKFNGTVDFDGEIKQGEKYMEFYPDADELMDTVVKYFYKTEN